MGYSPWGRKESDTTERLTHTHTHTHTHTAKGIKRGVELKYGKFPPIAIKNNQLLSKDYVLPSHFF